MSSSNKRKNPPRKYREEILQLLIDGVEGSEVIQQMKQRGGEEYKTSSLSSMVSRIKHLFLKGNHRHPDFYMSSLHLRKLSQTEPAVATFFSNGLEEQERIKRTRDTSNWSGEARYALAKLELLPPNMKTFKPDTESRDQLKEEAKYSVGEKVERLIKIENAAALLEEVWKILSTVTVEDRIAKIVLPLLFATGRRSIELLNGKSTFESMRNPYYAWFIGQVKKPGEDQAKPFAIPLLAPFGLVSRAYGILCEKQKRDDQKNTTILLEQTNEQVEKRYQSNLNRDMKYTGEARILKQLPQQDIHDRRKLTPHCLRAIYVKYINEYFLCPYGFPKVAEIVLGHEGVETSIRYNNVQLHPHIPGWFGPLKVNVFSREGE